MTLSKPVKYLAALINTRNVRDYWNYQLFWMWNDIWHKRRACAPWQADPCNQRHIDGVNLCSTVSLWEKSCHQELKKGVIQKKTSNTDNYHMQRIKLWNCHF